jgi:hypothetical protein
LQEIPEILNQAARKQNIKAKKESCEDLRNKGICSLGDNRFWLDNCIPVWRNAE